MSFLFKSKKNQGTALPAATRNITSAHGEKPPIASINGVVGQRDMGEKDRGTFQTQTPTPGSSVNASLNSLQGGTSTPTPETQGLRERANSDVNGVRGPPSGSVGPVGPVGPVSPVGPVGPVRPPGDSPYPWSQRRITFSTSASPFPRYGAAVNSAASKEGWVYLMGGLINSTKVMGDLWMVEAGSGNMACYPVITTSEGPGPRVGHASLLVGNAFIVFGGDTKLEDSDVLDDTLYLLNTATKQWSRALPAGPKPSGRYGHTLNILGSKIYIFGGQVEGYFFNDLVAFDLNTLQVPNNRWDIMIPNGSSAQGNLPAPRTNHSVVTWNDKLYLFGGTDGSQWFNDVWTYDPRTNSWTELDCIGYIPAPREGHSAALVNDTMYIFGGRIQDGTDLGDLAAFRISSRRWYMFQNMGMSPSPRSGHSMTAYGKYIHVLGGEPSSAPRDAAELSLSYVLDTSKIRYPPNDQSQQMGPNVRKMSGDRNAIPQSKAIPMNAGGGQPFGRAGEPMPGNSANAPGSRLPRPPGLPAPSGPPPQQQVPQPRSNGVPPAGQPPPPPRSRTPTKMDKDFGPGPIVANNRAAEYERDNVPPSNMAPIREVESRNDLPLRDRPTNGQPSQPSSTYQSAKPSMEALRSDSSVPSRNGSRSTRQQQSLESVERMTPRGSVDDERGTSRQAERNPVDSGVGSSPALSQQNDNLLKELEAAKSRNAWYASELALARKSGYLASSSTNPSLDERATDLFADDDRPLLEAFLKMRAELGTVQGSIDSQAVAAASRIAEVEKQRDAAVSEAAYAKAKLAAHGHGSQADTPQLESSRNTGSPDLDRANDMSRRLASALSTHNDLNSRIESVTAELQAERRARHMAEDTAEAAQKRVSELDLYRQRNASEVESMKAELHEAQQIAREEAANHAEASASLRLLEIDKTELSSKHDKYLNESKSNTLMLQAVQQAVTASSEKASMLERKLEEERSLRSTIEQRLVQLKGEHEERTMELESAHRRLHDAEELAEKNAAEANTHRQAVLSGLGSFHSKEVDASPASDERLVVLQQQVEGANALVRKNQEAADMASNKLRGAEERIAGLEAYQEQASREGLTIRKQLQKAMRDLQTTQVEKSEVQQQLERHQLEGNALEVQLKTLKNLLEERGISAADRRSRALDSPGLSSRLSTPDLTRVRELEQQLDSSLKAHEQMRHTFEQREQEVSRDWEEKLATLDNDHQGAVKYVRGLEKMLAKMKQELQRSKSANTDLEKELAQHRAEAATRGPDASSEPASWELERESLRAELAEMQANVKLSMGALESQINTLKSNLAEAEHERQELQKSASETDEMHQRHLDNITSQARADLEHLRHENSLLEERARDAEQKVQLFLDQFESSVDNYRRMSHAPIMPNGTHGHSRNHQSISGESIYSEATMTDTEDDPSDDESRASGEMTPNATSFPAAGVGSSSPGHARDRSSTALDSLATELDALRSHWEGRKQSYRLSDRFEFEKSPVSPSGRGELSDSLANWRSKLDAEEREAQEREAAEKASAVAKQDRMSPNMGPKGEVTVGMI